MLIWSIVENRGLLINRVIMEIIVLTKGGAK